jgi:hypothetical protein
VRAQLAFIKVSAIPFHTDGIAIFGIKDARLFEDTGVAFSDLIVPRIFANFLMPFVNEKRNSQSSLCHTPAITPVVMLWTLDN